MPARGRRVLVVGATGRLGVAIAHALAARGDRLILTARDPNKLAALAAELAPAHAGEPPPFVTADLTQRDAVDTVLAGIREKVRRIDDIVLACGPFPRTPFDDLRREDLEKTLTVHAIAPLLLVHALTGDLREGQGAVVGLGDAGTSRPYTNHVAYLNRQGRGADGPAGAGDGARAGRARQRRAARHRRRPGGGRRSAADPSPGDPARLLGRFGTAEEVVHVTLSLLDATWTTGETWAIGR